MLTSAPKNYKTICNGVLKPIKAYWTIGEGVVEDEVEEGVDEWFQ